MIGCDLANKKGHGCMEVFIETESMEREAGRLRRELSIASQDALSSHQTSPFRGESVPESEQRKVACGVPSMSTVHHDEEHGNAGRDNRFKRILSEEAQQRTHLCCDA